MRGTGLVMPPLHERMAEQARNQPELDAMYKELSSRSVPASYNAVSKGLYMYGYYIAYYIKPFYTTQYTTTCQYCQTL